MKQHLEERLAGLEAGLDRHQRGALKEDAFRKLRRDHGISGPRPDGFGLRLHFPFGNLRAEDFFGLAEASHRFGSGRVRLMSRQGTEILGVPAPRLVPLCRFLAKRMPQVFDRRNVGLKRALCCPRSGLCPYQAFDLREWLGRETELASSRENRAPLGAPFKMSFSGCGQDCGLATASDLGFIAVRKGNVSGFRVYTHPRPGIPRRRPWKLYDWVPCETVPDFVKAIEAVHVSLGQPEDSGRGAVSALAQSLGADALRALIANRLGSAAAKLIVTDTAEENPREDSGETDPLADSRAESPPAKKSPVAARYHVSPQAEADRYTIEIAPVGGTLEWPDMLRLVNILIELPLLAIRLGFRGNLYLGNVPGARLARIVKLLHANGIYSKAHSLIPVPACVGPEACDAALCNAPGLAAALTEAIGTEPDLARLLDIPISVSACPTNCSRHQFAAIGFSGSMGNLLGKPAPAYDIWLGGTIGEGRTRPAERVGRLLAGQVVPWLKEFLAPMREGGKAFLDYLHRDGGLKRAAESIRRLSAHTAKHGIQPELFIDIGNSMPFSPSYAATARAEAYHRDSASRVFGRSLAFRNRLASVSTDLDREAALVAVFRETCLALAVLLRVEVDAQDFRLDAVRGALVELGAAPAAEVLSKLESAYRYGRGLRPFREEILRFNCLVEMMVHAGRNGRGGER